jgi:alkanesulfonate monooxygenase SsuD/methylene tetrahydromethanopterin reductase-like flavin-dependent oxidoreductase (luciferase family)
MEIGVGLDGQLGLSYEEQAEVCQEAARLGYTSIWTNENVGEDSFLICAHRWRASAEVAPGGLTTGIAVSPAGVRTAFGFAMSAGTLSKMSGGRFILGIGTGGAYTPDYRRAWNLRGRSTLAMMSDYLTTIRALVRGETVTHEGQSVVLRGAKLNISPPPNTPVYLGALGPEMCRLGGELADGLALNWCSAEQVAWSRERMAEGAARAGRDPGEVKISEYIRICVDDDVDVARRAYTRALMGYALGPLGRPAAGYRAHFERMGYADELARVDELRAKQAPQEEVIDAFPEALLKAVGYYGPAAGAASAFRGLAEGLDTAIVRVVAARPGVASVHAVMEACQPAAVPA